LQFGRATGDDGCRVVAMVNLGARALRGVEQVSRENGLDGVLQPDRAQPRSMLREWGCRVPRTKRVDKRSRT